MDRRQVLTVLSGCTSVVLAGCGSLSNNRQEKPSARELFYEEIPRSPINVSLQYSTTENNSENVRIDINFEDIPESGEHGSVNISLDPNSSFREIPQEDKMSIKNTKGFSKTGNDTWKWDSETATPKISVILSIGDHPIGLGSNGQNMLLRTRSHVSPIVDIIRPTYDSTGTSEEENIDHGLSESLDISSSVTFESPAFPTEIKEFQPGRKEYIFSVLGDFQKYSLSRDEFQITTIRVPQDEYQCGSKTVLEAINITKQMFPFNSSNTELLIWEFDFGSLELAGSASSSVKKMGRFSVTLHASPRVWIHEFIHTEQQFSLGSNMTWFAEASAEYFTELALLQINGYEFARSFDEFYERYADFSSDKPISEVEHSEVPLAYDADAVLAVLDAEIRKRSQDNTLNKVFHDMNAYDGSVNYTVFKDLVADAAGERTDTWLDANVLQAANVSLPKQPNLFNNREQFGLPSQDDIKIGSVDCRKSQ